MKTMRAIRFFLFFLVTLMSMTASAQTKNAPLPGAARAAEAAFRHFSDPALSPESIRSMEFRHTSDPALSVERARSVENLRRHALRITETDTDYRVEVRFTGVVYGESARGIVASRQYRVDKWDFRLLEARQRIFDGNVVNTTPEALLSLPPQKPAAQNDAPLPDFARALALAHRDFASRRAATSRDDDPMRHVHNFVITVSDGGDYYEIRFSPKAEFLIIDGWTVYRVDKRDFRFLPVKHLY